MFSIMIILELLGNANKLVNHLPIVAVLCLKAANKALLLFSEGAFLHARFVI